MPGGKQQYWDLPICWVFSLRWPAVICTWLPLQRAACVGLTSVEVLLEGVLRRMSPFYVLFCYAFVSINDLIYKSLNRH